MSSIWMYLVANELMCLLRVRQLVSYAFLFYNCCAVQSPRSFSLICEQLSSTRNLNWFVSIWIYFPISYFRPFSVSAGSKLAEPVCAGCRSHSQHHWRRPGLVGHCVEQFAGGYPLYTRSTWCQSPSSFRPISRILVLKYSLSLCSRKLCECKYFWSVL